MDKVAILNGFNDHFIEFIDDIKRVFPYNKDIQIAHTGLYTIRKANPLLVCKIWKNAILSHYRISIESGDLDFFAKKDYSNDFPDRMKIIITKIDNFRKPLINLPIVEKQKVITYLQNLTKLNDLYFNISSA